MYYEMSCFGFPVGPGSFVGRVLPNSQNVNLGGLGMMIPSGSYMGSLGRRAPIRGVSARSVDLQAIRLGSLGDTGSAGGEVTSRTGDRGLDTLLGMLAIAVEGAPEIITAARGDSGTSTMPATSTGPSTAYYEAELERLRQAQRDTVAAATSSSAPRQIISGVSNSALFLGVGVLALGGIVAAVALRR